MKYCVDTGNLRIYYINKLLKGKTLCDSYNRIIWINFTSKSTMFLQNDILKIRKIFYKK